MKLIIHIGLPKTAVTTLSYLFENSKEVNFLGRPLVPIYNTLWQSMIFEKEELYKKKILKLKKKLFSYLSNKKKNVLLIEGITDPFFSINAKVNFIKRLGILKKIFEKDLEIEIIYVIRNQPDLILSRYIESPQFFKEYNTNWVNFELLKIPFAKEKFSKKDQIFFKKFFFYKNCKDLVNIFGKKKVNILLYEQLKKDKKNFANKLSKILNLKPNNVFKILKKYELNRSILTNNMDYIRKTHQISFILTNNFIYVKFNKIIPREIKHLFKNLFICFDKYLYHFIYKFYPKTVIKINEKEKKLIKKFYIYDNKKIEKFFKIELKENDYY